MVADLTDKDIQHLRRGGHDMVKIYAAYHRAVRTRGKPTVILAKTVKGWTLGGGAEARNTAHQVKKMSMQELAKFRDSLELPIADADLEKAPFYLPDPGSPEMEYLMERRRSLGGFVPQRIVRHFPVRLPAQNLFDRFNEATAAGKDISTTGAFGRLLGELMRDEELGPRVVPIVPDEARTFGLDGLFRRYGIYSALGQLYEPVDKELLISYREAKDGQMLEEGICEAGALASFTAAGTSYANHGQPMVPFYLFYSMFGYQRVGDQIWAAGDSRARGFLLGATAGRTTLNGEGLQHGDGHSALLVSVVPNLLAYDPAYHYEVATIIQDGLRRMLQDREDVLYYITLQNEAYAMPAKPAGADEGILKGLYRLLPPPEGTRSRGTGFPGTPGPGLAPGPMVTLLGSGSILCEVLRARDILAERYGVGAQVFSAPGYLQLRREALACERANMLHPEEPAQKPYVTRVLEEAGAGASHGPVIAASDWMKAVPDQISRWVPGGLYSLGTDGFGMSDTRQALRCHFEVAAESIVAAALYRLSAQGKIPASVATQAMRDLGIAADKRDPADVSALPLPPPPADEWPPVQAPERERVS